VKILWLGSAHPLVEQLVQLRDLYGLDAHIHEDPAPCDSVETAIRRIHGYGANVVVMPCGPTWLECPGRERRQSFRSGPGRD
jgi:hypothetical protein